MFKLGTLFLLFTVVFKHPQLAVSQSISSVDWEFQQVYGSLVDRENRIQSALGDLQKKLSSTVNNFVTSNTSSDLVTAMKIMRNLTMNLITINNYGPYEPTTTCNDIASNIGTIIFDINMCARINMNNAVNATLLMVQYNILYSTYLINYYSLSDVQRQNVQSLLTAWSIANDEYNQYTLTLVMAIYKYNVIYIELVILKNNFCSCPSQLSPNSATSLENVDRKLSQIQGSVDQSESSIRNISTDAFNKANVASSDIKSNSNLTQIINTLDTIVTLVKGYQKITTTDVINATANCDDAATKTAFIKYKWQEYYQAQIEASKNFTFVLVQYNTLNAFFVSSSIAFSSSQKQTVQLTITALSNLTEIFRQYIISLITAQVQLLQLQIVADQAKSDSCKCTERGNSYNKSYFVINSFTS